MQEFPLFKEKTLKRLRADIEVTQKHKNATKKWIKLLENDELQKEVMNYPKFMIYILQDLLGYDITTFKHEEKNMEFPFRDKAGNFLVCFEAKGTETKDLWSSQKRTTKIRETPVNQINDYIYKNKIPYGVLTNYRIFVLFKREEGYTKFHKFDFLDIKDNPEKLKEFILIFSRESFEEDKTESIYKESIIEERNFTKEFYKLYHETRLMILREFSERNIEKKLSLHHTQLFLNRLMFIFFAEDTGLLERRYFETKILEVLKSSGIIDNYTDYIFGKIKSIFRELDKEIPKQIKGFNGELFRGKIDSRLSFKDYRNSSFFKDVFQNYKLDKKLELNKEDNKIFSSHKNKLSRIISNILLMASFDFNTEINVNILGHIFEQSVSDIEELKGEKVLRRKKEGVYYTPDFITNYICRNTIIPYLSEKEVNTVDKLIEEYSDNIEELEVKFKSLKILDPACGSGSFLIKAVEVLLEIHKQIQIVKELEGQYTARKVAGLSRRQKRALRDNLQLTFSKWHEENEAREIIENNIFGVDINEESVEITKLSMFLKIATKNKKLIDLSKNIKCGNSLIEDSIVDARAFDWEKEFPFNFDIIIGNPPYLNMTRNNTNNAWLDYYDENYTSIRKASSKNLFVLFIEKSIDLMKSNSILSFIVPEGLFSTRSYSHCVDVLSNYGNVDLILTFESFVFDDAVTGNIIFRFIKGEQERKRKYFHVTDSKEVIHIKKSENQIEKKLNICQNKLSDICILFKGMVVKDRGNHVFTKNLGSSTPNEFYLGNCMNRYQIIKTLYCDYDDLTIVGGTKDKNKYMITPRIIIRRTGNSMCCTVLDKKALTESTLYSCIPTTDDIKIEYLLAILNSKLYTYFIRRKMITNKQAFPQILMTDLQLLPIKKIPLIDQRPFIKKVDLILKLNKDFINKKSKFFRRIFSSFDMNKSSNKLEKFWGLSFDEFQKEIYRLIKRKLSLKEQDEWEDYFNEYKKEILNLNEKINKTDKEINIMVYNLYDLTPDEIDIVEESLKN